MSEGREVVHDLGLRVGDGARGRVEIAHVEVVGTVEDHHLITFGDEVRAEVTADETPTTGDECPHQCDRPFTAAR